MITIIARFFVWRKLGNIEYGLIHLVTDRFDYIRSACFNRDTHVLSIMHPFDFKVIKNFPYIGTLYNCVITKMIPS